MGLDYPAMIGEAGVDRVIEAGLPPQERTELERSEGMIREAIAQITG